MELIFFIFLASTVFCAVLGFIAPAIAEGAAFSRAAAAAAGRAGPGNKAFCQLFLWLAVMESVSVYCLIAAIIIVFTSPLWAYLLR